MITLDRLVNVLGGYGVRLCGRPETRSAWLRSVAVPDATDRHVTGDLLLAVGTSSIAEAVRWAAAARAAAVLVRPVETATGTGADAPCASPSAAADLIGHDRLKANLGLVSNRIADTEIP
ncbi:hypothetical protein AB0C30_52260, partial [Nonomuraea sp. NPDC048901]